MWSILINYLYFFLARILNIFWDTKHIGVHVWLDILIITYVFWCSDDTSLLFIRFIFRKNSLYIIFYLAQDPHSASCRVWVPRATTWKLKFRPSKYALGQYKSAAIRSWKPQKLAKPSLHLHTCSHSTVHWAEITDWQAHLGTCSSPRTISAAWHGWVCTVHQTNKKVCGEAWTSMSVAGCGRALLLLLSIANTNHGLIRWGRLRPKSKKDQTKHRPPPARAPARIKGRERAEKIIVIRGSVSAGRLDSCVHVLNSADRRAVFARPSPLYGANRGKHSYQYHSWWFSFFSGKARPQFFRCDYQLHSSY